METSEKFELQSAEVDATVAEMETFNSLVDAIDNIPAEVKETLPYETSFAKFGGPADAGGGFSRN